MKFYITILFAVFSLVSFAQKVEKDGTIYEVKKERIFLKGEDVTETLNAEKRTIILKEATALSDKMKLEEKAKKKQEKAKRKKEKALKKEQKRKANYTKAQDKLAKAQKKYGRLKNKGKLSPVDEDKWLNKIEKLTENVEKAKRKL